LRGLQAVLEVALLGQSWFREVFSSNFTDGIEVLFR
jgi:hypothetical protein